MAAALDAEPGAKCVILTSPTYEGVLSDVRSIAEICHARGVTLLVDEAHGAHYLPFAAQYGWQDGAVAAGADLVVQSAHKTLPSLTQTAFLQLNGDLADPAEVERQLDVFETSSPSYPLMASLDGCTRWLAEEGSAAFAAWRARLDRFDAAVKDLQKTKVMCFGRDALDAHPCFFAHDSGKILLQIGTEGAAYLRADGFEPEMVCGPNVLAMTSPCDEENALDRLAVVLHAGSSKARFADAATLLNFAFANYSLYSIASNTVIPPVRVRFAETDSVQPVLSGADAIVVRKGTAAPQTDIALDEDLCAPLEPGAQVGTVTITGSSGDTLILPLIVPGGAARISTTHLWLQLLRAL